MRERAKRKFISFFERANVNSKIINFDVTVQNKLIIVGLLVSTLLIVGVSIFAIGKIQEKLYESYANFGQLLGKTIAVQSVDWLKNAPSDNKLILLKAHSNSIVESNSDIAYITYKDAHDKVLYSTSEFSPDRAKASKTNLSTPIMNKAGKLEGSVEIGLNATMASVVAKTTKGSMLLVFTLIWVVFSIVVVINTFLMTRELSLLKQGVKEISSGKFGTILENKDASGEIKDLFAAFNQMSLRLHKYEEQNVDTLTIERNKFEAVLMGIVNGVVVCDSSDNVVLINPSASNILSAKEEEILNTKIQEYVDTEGIQCFKDEIQKFKDTPLEEMEQRPLEFNVNVHNNVIETIISPMYSKSHDYLGYIIILIDITKEAEVDKLKSDFISNVSHELRTPVTILRGYIDTLYSFGDEFKFEEQREFIGVLNQEIIRLNKMVNDILDFSRLQSDARFKKEEANILDTIELAVSELKVLAKEKGIKFSIKKQENLPLVSYNRESMESVLANLITNAIKYSTKNSSVSITAETTECRGFIKVCVSDNGIGIAKEHLDRLFDRFYRVENDTHTIKGTGLGLHLVKVAVEKHHSGEVFVESEIGSGSTFGFLLPLNVVETDAIVEDDLIDGVIV